MQLVAGVLGRAGEEGQRKRLEAAKTGQVTWQPPQGMGMPRLEESVRPAPGSALEREMNQGKSS